MAEQSFPDVWVTGVVHHFVRIPGDTNPYYLGTAEVTPQMQRVKYRQPVFNDIGGKTLPFQKTYDGEAARVSTLLTRFSRSAWERALLAGRASDPLGLFGKAAAPVSGTEGRWSRGHLVFGVSSLELWQVFDNALNPVFAASELELGWYWPQVTIENHDTVAAGTQAEKLLIVFDCQPKWIPQASHSSVDSASNERGFVLYSTLDADFPASVRIPQ